MEAAQLCPPQLRNAIADMRAVVTPASDAPEAAIALATEAAEVIGALTGDAQLAAAVLAQPMMGRAGVTPESLERLLGAGAARVALDLQRLGEIGLSRDWAPERGLDAHQAETVRKMLLAVVGDQRLVLARLAEALVRLRHARDLAVSERERLAMEVRAIFAPLANRLGIWQLKWELEDLAFRYLEPEEYRQLAAALNERRADRERYIEDFCARLRASLAAAAVSAQVYGRPKHIFSIYRKMLRKHLPFEQIFDVRAVRIVVDSVAECYAALSVVHGEWQYIPAEFDDYIATPKDNQYRSIHTAVVGPEQRSVEIQIRTREMHDHAELGIAAHWQYKEGNAHDAEYQRKIEAVRRLLHPEEQPQEEPDVLESLRGQIFADHIYALTPKGEVVELPRGGTPLDFAYQVHSNLGHRCRGAKVNGRIVPLTYQLSNGEVVDIIAGKHPAPSRDWLAPELGYLASARSRTKVRAWFRRQDSSDNRAAGRSIAEREMLRAGAGAELLPELMKQLRAPGADDFYQLLGEGEITATQLSQALLRLVRPAAPELPVRKPRPAGPARRHPVDIEGVGDLPITLASCCAPLRPQPIVGYITIGRGVTIHRAECRNFARMRAEKPERMLQVEWSSGAQDLIEVELVVFAYDRRGLVRDITDVVAQERLSIEGMNTLTDEDRIARVALRLGVADLEQLGNLVRRLQGVPNVSEVRRTR
ncbi:MAG TPA: bifunctional (p)ppGpp synthetase/guanosine-3',5'-bis(diphosphate) 3'-pyrophosphohydrolase [Steroidobacteraceae bacterium]|nr:bifunctional (p)ppGpp synthetase/guanosine-3',5'-bis(diphosphate) 3'-pyrophosphohydrolase [Steroidobacteraceae bacterium]